MTTGSNLRIWDAVKTPPQDALKKITGGRLAGKTDIDPVWRMQVITELFGPEGLGWKKKIDRLWTEPGSDGQVVAFAQVSFQYKATVADDWSEPLEGTGGSMLIVKERSGLHTNDEAFKMAVTDAIGTALKGLGVAANVYRGKMDGSKYTKQQANGGPLDTPAKPPTMPQAGDVAGNALAAQMAKTLREKFEQAQAIPHLENTKKKHEQSLALIKHHLPDHYAKLKELYQARMAELRPSDEPPHPADDAA